MQIFIAVSGYVLTGKNENVSLSLEVAVEKSAKTLKRLLVEA